MPKLRAMALLASPLGQSFALLDAVEHWPFLLGGVAFVVVAAFEGVDAKRPSDPSHRLLHVPCAGWMSGYLRDPVALLSCFEPVELFDFSAAEPPVERSRHTRSIGDRVLSNSRQIVYLPSFERLNWTPAGDH